MEFTYTIYIDNLKGPKTNLSIKVLTKDLNKSELNFLKYTKDLIKSIQINYISKINS